MNEEIYLADLDSKLFKTNENAHSKLLLSIVVFIGLIIVSYAVAALLDRVAPGTGISGPVLQIMILLSFIFLCWRVIIYLLGISFNNKGMRSAVICKGDCLTVMTMKADFESVADTFVGTMGLSVTNGFNTEDLLGYAVLKQGANSGGKAQNSKVKLMQDANFVGKYAGQRLSGIKYKDYYGCVLAEETEKMLVFSAHTKKGNQTKLKLNKIYKSMDNLKTICKAD